MDLSAAHWRKSSKSGDDGGLCVEVADNVPGVVVVRDSKNPSGPFLVFSRAEWAAFLAEIRNS